MPIQSEPARGAVIRVTPSAPLELMWVMHLAQAGYDHGGAYSAVEVIRQRFGPQINRLRSDGIVRCETELVVLAHRSGTLQDPDMERFFARVEAAALEPGRVPSLRSESAEELRVVHARLRLLQEDAEHRKRYIALLRAIWSAVEDEWSREGRAAATAEAQRWSRTLEDGASYRTVLETASLWPGRPDIDTFSDVAAAEGNLVLTPCWFGGKIHIIELDGLVYAGRGFRQADFSYKKVASEVSTSIKALADPTRLAILLRLARDPASVTELAKQFQISQPTVSAHVQILREAGLIDEKTVGRSASLSASEDGLRRLFTKAQESLTSVFRE